ncbi:MAG: YggS family pyridoxal phosphate-dependent enzyme, partial [Desulfobulbaceae bacterium]|nr:YggS family pyridoxal phosphate-dependent enzyme [Desulfobulbaceae bacterium]
MISIEKQIGLVRENIARSAERVGRDPAAITLVAVTKRVEEVRLREAIAAGQGVFGENYLQ